MRMTLVEDDVVVLNETVSAVATIVEDQDLRISDTEETIDGEQYTHETKKLRTNKISTTTTVRRKRKSK